MFPFHFYDRWVLSLKPSFRHFRLGHLAVTVCGVSPPCRDCRMDLPIKLFTYFLLCKFLNKQNFSLVRQTSFKPIFLLLEVKKANEQIYSEYSVISINFSFVTPIWYKYWTSLFTFLLCYFLHGEKKPVKFRFLIRVCWFRSSLIRYSENIAGFSGLIPLMSKSRISINQIFFCIFSFCSLLILHFQTCKFTLIGQRFWHVHNEFLLFAAVAYCCKHPAIAGSLVLRHPYC